MTGVQTCALPIYEALRKPKQFDEQGYRGTIVPVPGHGSIAVLMRDANPGSGDVERIAARVDDSIIWTR